MSMQSNAWMEEGRRNGGKEGDGVMRGKRREGVKVRTKQVHTTHKGETGTADGVSVID